ncbi:MAG: ABC transporter permease [Acidobacteriia bacterium]|nr:ABC transporter permease [Terriglobia bacterium]
MINDLLYRLRAVVLRNRMERELDDELRFHTEHEVEKLEEAGLSPKEARRRARLASGGAEQVKEECRDARGTAVLESFLRDLRYAGRVLRAHPGFTAVVVLSLGLGIGATTSIFTVINAVLLRTLPVRDPENLVVAYWKADGGLRASTMNNIDRKDPASGQRLSSIFPLMALREFGPASAEGLEVFGFYIPGKVGISDGATTFAAHCTLVTGNFFEGLGVRMALGRPLTESDDRSGATVAVVTYDFWQRSLHGDVSILGKTVRVNGAATTVVGVSGAGFHGIASAGWGGPTEVFLPLGALDNVLPREFRFGKPKTAPDLWWVQLVGRKKAGVTTEAAATRLTARFRGMLLESGVPGLQQARNPRLILLPGDKGLGTLRDSIERPLMFLFGVVGLVLLLACINVANLQLARSAARQREVAVRLSLGASRPRIVRQLLTESLLLSAVGALVGFLLAVGGSRFIAAQLTATFETVALDLQPDLRVLGFTMLVSVASAVLFGLVPALKASRADIAPNLKEGARASGRRRSAWAGGILTGRALIAVQVSLSVVLLAGSGLLLRTLGNLEQVDPGFARDRVLTFRLDAGQLGYGPQQVGPLYDRVLDSARATPGVVQAAALSHPLIGGWHNGTDLSSPALEGGRPINVWMNIVSPEFFQTMGMPIVEGRPLSAQDTDSSHHVMVMNQAAAHRFFGERPAVGQILLRNLGKGPFQVEVVGVVRDAKYDSLRKAPVPTVFVSYAQENSPFTGRSFAVRTAGDPAAMAGAVRQAILRINRDLVMADVKTQRRLIEDSLYQERLYALLLTLFGAFALVLAAIGLHGVTAYSTARRTAELGLRMALGATRNQMLALVLRQALIAVAMGMAAGACATWAASRWISTLLFGVRPVDPPGIAVVFLLLAAVASGAALIPAWRATRFDPMAALRAE